jgi:hypothetical protein
MGMKKVAVLAVVGMTLAGCSTYPAQDRVLRGALIGGATGGIVGAVATGTVGGAAVGAGIGAVAGAAIAAATTPGP